MTKFRVRSVAATGAWLLLSAFGMAASAWAEPLDPSLQAQLLNLYDRYNKAIIAGNFEAALGLRSAEARQALHEVMANPAERKQFPIFVAMTTPDTMEVRHTHLAKDGQSASILVIAHKTIPANAPPGGPPPGTVSVGELTLNFVKEGGAWRFDANVFGMDPSKLKACKNTAFEPIDAYDKDRNTSMGGPIVSIDYEADYTLLIVRVTDEEDCVYLPKKADLQTSGLNLDLLLPYAIADIEGFPHKSDPQKVWADHITVNGDY